MTATSWYVGLDIGSSTVAVAAAAPGAGGRAGVVGCEVLPSAGVVRGEVTDPVALEGAVGAALARVAAHLGGPVAQVALSVSGLHVRRTPVVAEQRNRRIVRLDADRLAALHRQALRDASGDGVVVASVMRGCRIDGLPVADPLAGLYGQVFHLSAEVYRIPASYVDARARILARLGATVDLLLPRAMAAAEAALAPSERHRGAVLIDLGGATTDVAVYLDGQVRELFAIPLGARAADRAPTSLVALFHRIRQRLDDRDLGRRIAGGVLVGGGAYAAGVRGAAQRGLRVPVRVGAPAAPLFADPRFATAVGLALAQARLRPIDPVDLGTLAAEPAPPVALDDEDPAPERPGWLPALGRWLREFVPLGGSE
ncbi:MAG: hypothetical protein QJR03_01450 [Sphaerobacter sp.]|nr:hypothetical protein [Sphaerobacter sp.]